MGGAPASESILMNDVMDDFLDGTQFCVHQHVGAAVKRLALGQQLTDSGLRFWRLEQRAMTLVAHPLPDCFGRRPETDDQGVGFQADEVFLPRDQAASGRDHRAVEGLESLDHGSFVFPELRFTFLGKDCGNSPASPRFDEFVRVGEPEMQVRSHELADRRLAGSHETDEGQVMDDTTIGHGIDLTQNQRTGTQFL